MSASINTDEWSHRRVKDVILVAACLVISGRLRGKEESFTTCDTTTSEWSRFFVDECPTTSSRLWEDINRCWSMFDEPWSWDSDFNSRMSSWVKCLLHSSLALRFVLVYFSSRRFICCFAVKVFIWVKHCKLHEECYLWSMFIAFCKYNFSYLL